MTSIELLGIQFESSLPLLAALPALLVFLILNRDIHPTKKTALILALRVLVILSLLAILAMPFTTSIEQILQETTSVLVIADRSGSMQLFREGLDSEVHQTVKSSMGELSEVGLKNITTPGETAIGDAIYEGVVSSAQENNVIVLVSDGNSNRGRDPLDVASFASEANTRIFTVAPDLSGQELLVHGIIGSSSTPADAEYSGEVIVEAVGGNARYRLTISLDGTVLIDRDIEQTSELQSFPFTHLFTEYGPHNITARLVPSTHDLIAENNVLVKVVNVIEKPSILLASKRSGSPLHRVLDRIYDLTFTDDLAGRDLDGYAAVVIDDLNEEEIGDVDALKGFLSDGGGILVVGGEDAYDAGDYYESRLETLLPVKSTEQRSKQGKQIAIVVLIDISGSTGKAMGGGDTKIDVEKALAIQMIRDLAGKDVHIAIVAFNSEAFTISAMRDSAGRQEFLEDKIARLQFGGGTYVFTGQLKARQMLEDFQGAKYILLISDGVTNYPVQSFNEAANAFAEGIRTYSIGVGFDTDPVFLAGLARTGGGVYFAPDQSERVKLTLVGEKKEEAEHEGFVLAIQDQNHFITQTLDLANVSVLDFNEVSPKSSAQVLVATQSLDPVLTVWRFSLGRVASLTTDDGADWAGDVYGAEGSKLVSSTLNWLVGGPQRDKETWIDCKDIHLGDPETVIVTSTAPGSPRLSVDGQEIQLSRLSEDKFYGRLVPGKTGVFTLHTSGDSCTFAVNYPREYQDLSPDMGLLTKLAEITGGSMFRSTQLGSLAEAARQYTTQKSTGEALTRNGLHVYFLIIAIALLLMDIVIRRLDEILQGRRIRGGKIVKPKKRRKSRRFF